MNPPAAEVTSPEPAMSRKAQLPPVINQTVPDELLLSLSSVSGPGAHQRHCEVQIILGLPVWCQVAPVS